MSNRIKIVLVLVGLVAVGGIVGANLAFHRSHAIAVTMETLESRPIEAVVRASGRLRALRYVDISANVIGRVEQIAVREGQTVATGDLLLQIDPTPFDTSIARAEAATHEAELALSNAQTRLEQSQLEWQRQQGLMERQLGTQQAYDQARTDFEIRRREVDQAALRLDSERANLANARHERTKVELTSPLDGVVTRVSVEVGENVLMGTMNNAGTRLMTISDLSEMQVELEVDETEVVQIAAGQAAKVTVDAVPNRDFGGTVTEIGASPIEAQAGQGDGRLVKFRVVVTLRESFEGLRPGFSATATVTTAERESALAVPIQALVSREVGEGEEKEEKDGIFVAVDGRARFRPIEVGIHGEKYFEVLSGLSAGDRAVTGPYRTLRDLKEGDEVRAED